LFSIKSHVKTVSTLLFVLIYSVGFSQSAREFYNSANQKPDRGQYKEAIQDCSKSIEQPEPGCEDFRKALDLGQNKALEYVAKYCK
jgi:hypothetical protein